MPEPVAVVVLKSGNEARVRGGLAAEEDGGYFYVFDGRKHVIASFKRRYVAGVYFE